jgi:hypothetical protein
VRFVVEVHQELVEEANRRLIAGERKLSRKHTSDEATASTRVAFRCQYRPLHHEHRTQSHCNQ